MGLAFQQSALHIVTHFHLNSKINEAKQEIEIDISNARRIMGLASQQSARYILTNCETGPEGPQLEGQQAEMKSKAARTKPRKLPLITFLPPGQLDMAHTL